MEVLILEGNMAQDLNNNVYMIEGIEVIRKRDNGQHTEFYGTDTAFFRAVAVPGLKSSGYIIPGSRRMMLR